MLFGVLSIVSSVSIMLAAPPAAAPAARRQNLTEQLHGVPVSDPYRWMEDVDSPETRTWVQAEVAFTNQYLAKLPGREQIRKRLEELTDFPTSQPTVVKRGGKLFYQRKQGYQNQPVLFVQDPGGQPRELLNPNLLSKEGTAALATWRVSTDGRLLAYGIARAGSDWEDWRVRDVATGKDMADSLEWIKFSDPEWSAAGDGFYYSRYPKPENGNVLTSANYDNKVYYHRIGTKQSEDQLIYERPDQREWSFDSWTSEDGNYLLIMIHKGTGVERQVLVRDLRQPHAQPKL